MDNNNTARNEEVINQGANNQAGTDQEVTEPQVDIQAANNQAASNKWSNAGQGIGKFARLNKPWIVAAVAGTALVASFALGFAMHNTFADQGRAGESCQRPAIVGVMDDTMAPDWFAPMPAWRAHDLSSVLSSVPRISTKNTSKSVVVTANLPAINPENLNVRIEGHSLLITGQEHDKLVNHERNAQEQCAISSFQAALPLPQNVQPDKMQTNYRNGILTISIPKT